MDLGLSGRRALVCAASKGLGKGCALALAREGVAVTITARTAEVLERTADEIRSATGVTVIVVAGDIATEAGRAAALAACPEPDILVNNAGGPPPGDFITRSAISVTSSIGSTGWSIRRSSPAFSSALINSRRLAKGTDISLSGVAKVISDTVG